MRLQAYWIILYERRKPVLLRIVAIVAVSGQTRMIPYSHYVRQITAVISSNHDMMICQTGIQFGAHHSTDWIESNFRLSLN